MKPLVFNYSIYSEKAKAQCAIPDEFNRVWAYNYIIHFSLKVLKNKAMVLYNFNQLVAAKLLLKE